MAGRVATHRLRRADAWETFEEPLALTDALGAAALPGSAVLVECLTLWLSNLMEADRDIDAETRRLLAALEEARASSSPTRSARASSRPTRSAATTPTPSAPSTSRSPPPPTTSFLSPPDCRSSSNRPRSRR
jgi:hypothetical protein